MKFRVLISFIFLFCTSTRGQVLKKQKLTQNDKQTAILNIYTRNKFENPFELVLYKNHSFNYKYKSTNYFVESNGTWHKSGANIILNSEVDSNNVSVKIFYINADKSKSNATIDNPSLSYSNHKTIFYIPENVDKAPFPDSKIFVNNDTSFCFPYFDTCIGNIGKAKKIKIDFGNGFKTKWIPLEQKNYKSILVIVKTHNTFTNYHSFINQKLIVSKNQVRFETK